MFHLPNSLPTQKSLPEGVSRAASNSGNGYRFISMVRIGHWIGRQKMKIIYTADVHGIEGLYSELFRLALNRRADAIITGNSSKNINPT